MPDAPTAVIPTGLPSAPSAPVGVAGTRPLTEKFATLMLGTTANRNAILFTNRARGETGNGFSIEMVNAASGTAETTATIASSLITVNLAEQARLVIGGPVTPIRQRTVFYDGVRNGRNSWNQRSDDWFDLGTTEIYYQAGVWVIICYPNEYEARKTSTANSPVGLTGWTVIRGSGQPTITAARPDAWQVVEACNLPPDFSPNVSSYIYAEVIGDDDGAVLPVAATQFSGGVDFAAFAPNGVQAAEEFDEPGAPPAVQAGGMPSAPSAPGAVQG